MTIGLYFGLNRILLVIFTISALGMIGFSSHDAYAANITAVKSGNWNDGNTWGGSVPGANDVAIIPSGKIVTVPGGTTVNIGAPFTGGTANIENIDNSGTINNQGSLIAINSETLTNSGTITNTGTISFTGTSIANSGMITNTGGTLTGEITSNSGTITSSGTLTTTGSLSFALGNSGTITSTGTFNNLGGIWNSGTINIGSGTFTNTGYIHNNNGGHTHGTITNSGTINIPSNSLIANDNGTLTNSGTINNNGTLANNFNGGEAPGTLTNSGTINNGGGPITGTINNNAGSTFTNNNIINNNHGSLIWNTGGTFDNYGTITSNGTLDNRNIFSCTCVTTFTNHPGSTITNNGTLTTGFDDPKSIFTNGGTINTTGKLYTYDIFSNTGIITNSATLTIYGGTLTNNNKITNSGTLANFGGTPGITNIGTITNTGIINNDVTLSNNGTITNGVGAKNGTINNPGGTINNFAGTSSGLGILINNANSTIKNGDTTPFGSVIGIIASNGTITSYGNIISFGTITDSGGSFNNYGTIMNPGTITISNTNGSPSTLTNYNVINNYGPLAGGFTGGGTITNSGTIKNLGKINLLSAFPSGTLINNSDGTLQNSNYINDNGTINNSGSFSNSGTITTNSSGSITNNLGGNLTNSGTIILGGAFLTNNGNMINNPGGTITDNSGSSINNGGAIINNSGGIINNNAGGSLNNGDYISNNGIISNSGTLTSSQGYITNGGTINNFATLTNSGTDTTISNFVNGTITNSGTLAILSNQGGTVTNSGKINNNSGGSITNLSSGIITNNCEGTINNNSGSSITNTSNSTINNNGTINNNSGATFQNLATFNGNPVINSGGTVIGATASGRGKINAKLDLGQVGAEGGTGSTGPTGPPVQCEIVNIGVLDFKATQGIEKVGVLIKDKPTAFKLVIKNTFATPKDIDVVIKVNSVALPTKTIHITGNCEETFYLQSTIASNSVGNCNGKSDVEILHFTLDTIGTKLMEVTLDPSNHIGNNDGSLKRYSSTLNLVLDTNPITVLYAPINQPALNFDNSNAMAHPCDVKNQVDGGYCSPNLATIGRASEFMGLVYPVANLQYVRLDEITNARHANQFFPVITASETWKELKRLKDEWIQDQKKNGYPPTGTILIMGWLPKGTLDNGEGDLNGDSRAAVSDESVGDIPQSGDLSISEELLAHELGHAIGLHHPQNDDQCGGTTFNSPYKRLKIGALGYNIISGNEKDPSINEFMTGGHCVPLTQEKWISPEGWNKIIDILGTVTAQAQIKSLSSSGQSISISGSISTNGSVATLDPIFETTLPEDLTSGPFTLKTLALNGSVLYSQNFNVTRLESENLTQSSPEPVFSFVAPPLPAGTAKIQILNGTNILDSVNVPAHTPQVKVIFPNGGETLSGFQTVQWTSSDVDGGTLYHNIDYSFDNGTTWNTIAFGVTGNSSGFDFDQLPGNGKTALIRVTASDGVNSNSSISMGPFFVANKPPSVFIQKPQNNTSFSSLDNVILQGAAVDIENGFPPPNTSFVWTNETGGFLGNGSDISVGPLKIGTHKITLTIANSAGNKGSASATIMVNPPSALTVVKRIVNTHGGNLTMSGVTLLINGVGVTNGTANLEDPGIYTVSEVSIPGYTATFSGDCNSGGNVTLATNDNKVCTITNHDVASSSCVPPISGDWTLTSSCTLTSTSTAQANVIVQTGQVLTIPNGMKLNIDFTHFHLLVKSGGGISIKAGGAIN